MNPINVDRFGKAIVTTIGIVFICVVKNNKTRSHTDGFQRNNAKCLDEKGISRFVPHSSI